MRTLNLPGQALIIVGWLMFLTSFFLPSTNVLEMSGTAPGSPLTGWQAFGSSLSAGAFNPWAWLGDVRVVGFLIFPVTNAIMLAAPTYCFLKTYSLPAGLILIPAAIAPWLMPHELRGDLYVGFYLWNSSYFLIALGCLLIAVISWCHELR